MGEWAAQRRHEEEAEEAAVEQQNREKQKREDRAAVDTFLKDNGFKSITAKRKKLCSTTYPLHVAVSQNSADMVRLLLRCGADPFQKNSSGYTPQQVAQKCNKRGTHEQVLLAFNRP